MKIFSILLIITLSIFFTACENEAQTVIKETPSFDKLKEKRDENFYTLKTVDNKEIKFEYINNILTSKDLNGKIVLINFFATWCPPCIKEIPTFNQLTEMYPNDFKIVSILFQDPIELAQLKEFIKNNNINFDITVGEENIKLAKAFNNVQKVPESYLFTKDGIMIEKFLGAIDGKSMALMIEELKKQ